MSTSSLALRTSVFALSVVGMSAYAEWRCDCTTILDACNATVTVENDGVAIESDQHGSAAYQKQLIRVYLRRTIDEARRAIH